MRLQIASDLHLEQADVVSTYGGLPVVGADVLVLAGDVHRGAAGVATFSNWPGRVVYVLGNHEHYGSRIDMIECHVKERAHGTSINVLACDELVLSNTRFLGCTLWTDYRLNRSHHKSMARARGKADEHLVRDRLGAPFTPERAVEEYRRSVSWLESQLGRRHRGPTVVVSHHAPHARSIPERYRRQTDAACFASDLSRLLPQCDLWIHGHVHASANYRERGAKIICNPRGRPVNIVAGSHVVGSNAAFRPGLVYEL
jgi:predicted phosphodiesterase